MMIREVDSIEAYAYGTRKDAVTEKKEIKCNNLMERYRKWLSLNKKCCYKRKYKRT